MQSALKAGLSVFRSSNQAPINDVLAIENYVLRTTLISGPVAKLTPGNFGRISTLSSSFVTSGVVFLVCGVFSKNGHFYDG